ncbi:nucleoside hydrolase [Corynebacterium mayonis]|uniref:nucleoside hydrolase n=1 Tax=Corynebacterium mayonis TaxID=3062461 RepID=UPI0031401D7C
MARPLILDLDTGIDDTLALAYALASPEVELIGVTATYGNVTVEQGARNSLAMLEMFGATHVPVFLGPGHARTRSSFEVAEISSFIHGANGIGEVEIPDAARAAQDTSAVDFLIDSVRRYGEDLVIVPTGPSTSVAAAIEASKGFADNAHIVMMAGALTVPGNVTACSEANVYQDPEAADLVFRRARDVTMVGLDVTLRTLLTSADTAQWKSLGTKRGEVLAALADYYIGAYATTSPHLGGCGLHDPLAVAIAIDPDLATYVELNLKVDTAAPLRGRTIGDETRLGQVANTRVAVSVDVEAFRSRFMHRLSALASASS